MLRPGLTSLQAPFLGHLGRTSLLPSSSQTSFLSVSPGSLLRALALLWFGLRALQSELVRPQGEVWWWRGAHSVHSPCAWGLCPSGPTPGWLSITLKQLLLKLRDTQAIILYGGVSPMQRALPGPQKVSLAVTATLSPCPPPPILPLAWSVACGVLPEGAACMPHLTSRWCSCPN